MGNRLYVGNLPYTIDEAGLRSFFGDGVDGVKVTQVKIITDRETGRPRGFAFVELGSPEHAKAAITKFNGQDLGGRTIVVNEAREPPGGGGGRPHRMAAI